MPQSITDYQDINITKGSKPLEQWKEKIKSGIRYRTIFGKSADWSRYKNQYRGFWQGGIVPVNITYSIGRSLIPQIYFRNPRVAVHPARPGYAMHARMWERLDNYFIRELDIKGEMKSDTLDCYLCGRGPGIIGYDTEYGFNPSFMADDYGIDASLTGFNKKGERIEYNYNVKPGMPWYLRCNPLDFVVPWGTHKWEEVQWFAFRKMRMLKDIKEDPKYKNKAHLKAPYQNKLEASVEGRPESQSQKWHSGMENEWVELWQIHDQKTGMVFGLSLDHNKFLREDTDYLQIEGLPALVLGFNEDPDYFWWQPDVRLIEVQQQEINDIRTMAKKHRRVALLKLLYDKNLLKKDELTKLLDEDPKAAVAIENLGANDDVRKAVAMLQSHVPPDLTLAAKEVREDVREIVGFSRNQMGAFEDPGGRRTAHEVETVRAASMIRIDERRDIMADHLEKIVRRINQLVATHWTQERVIDVIGPDGARYWVRFTGPQIKGEFHFKINPEEAVPEDRRTRRAEALQFIQQALQTPDINAKYLLEQYAAQFDWIDSKMLFPGEGMGRSPEMPMPFHQFMNVGMRTPWQGARRI